jgi:hypothetical protein
MASSLSSPSTPHNLRVCEEAPGGMVPVSCIIAPWPINACHDGLFFSLCRPVVLPLYFPASCKLRSDSTLHVPLPAGNTLLTWCWRDVACVGVSHDVPPGNLLARTNKPWPMLIGCPEGETLVCYETVSETFPYALLRRSVPVEGRLSYQMGAALHRPSRVLHFRPSHLDPLPTATLNEHGIGFRPITRNPSCSYPIESLATRYRLHIDPLQQHAACWNPACDLPYCQMVATRVAIAMLEQSPYLP